MRATFFLALPMALLSANWRVAFRNLRLNSSLYAFSNSSPRLSGVRARTSSIRTAHLPPLG